MPETGSLRDRITTSTRCARVVEALQLLHQRKRHAGRGWLLQPLKLQLHVGAVVALLEDAVSASKSNSAREEMAIVSGDRVEVISAP
jgi:hypothetical protein